MFHKFKFENFITMFGYFFYFSREQSEDIAKYGCTMVMLRVRWN